VTDITFIRALEGFAYLAVAIDLYFRRVVGWSMQSVNRRANGGLTQF
jgi:putative transposase